MIIYTKTKIDEEMCRLFELGGEKFIAIPNGCIFHYRSGSPWELNGKYDNPRRSEKVLRMTYDSSAPWTKKEMMDLLRKLPTTNGKSE